MTIIIYIQEGGKKTTNNLKEYYLPRCGKKTNAEMEFLIAIRKKKFKIANR